MVTLQGLGLTEHTLTVPLTTSPADPRTIDVFARVITREGGSALPYLVFLQGGPGSEAPRVAGNPATPVWLPEALKRYRVVMIDQRGTGRSTPVTEDLLATGSAEEVAEYLTHLRADAIVRDCEAFRTYLGATPEQWNLLGQSFGGFTATSYLSANASSLNAVFFTGGLPPVTGHVDDFYSATFDKMRWLSENYYREFPEDRDKFARLLSLAAEGKIVLPTSGEIVSPSRLRSIGIVLGANEGWMTIHNLLEWDPSTATFRHDLEALLPFGARNPLYFLLHEACGANGGVTGWSADRVMPQDFREDLTLFTGEHVSEQWLDTVPHWRQWAEVARILATHEWPTLFDVDALQQATNPGAAAIYVRDAYVPFEFSMETAEYLRNVREVITNGTEHNGLRAWGGDLLGHLFDVAASLRYR